jgi:hypothetical protein
VFFIICIPLVNMIVPQDPWSTVLLPLVGAAIICVGVGVVQSHSSAQHPQQDHLLYSLNADDHNAVWASYDRAPDAYTAQFLQGTGLSRFDPKLLDRIGMAGAFRAGPRKRSTAAGKPGDG